MIKLRRKRKKCHLNKEELNKEVVVIRIPMRKRRNMKVKRGKLPKGLWLSSHGLALTATSLMLKITCPDISAIVNGMMNQAFLLLFSLILVESIAIRRETTIALMEDAMYFVIQVVAHLAPLMCQ